MEKSTSTLILVGDITKYTSTQDDLLTKCVDESIDRNNHKIVFIDITTPPNVTIRLKDHTYQKKVTKEEMQKDVIAIIDEYMNQRHFTVIAYLENSLKESVGIRAFLTWKFVNVLP